MIKSILKLIFLLCPALAWKSTTRLYGGGSTFGRHFRVSSFGESHGICIGAVIDGCPPRIPIKESEIQTELERRKPGQSDITTQRKEPDRVRVLSGVVDGISLGSPIALSIDNIDQQSKDYGEMQQKFRPSHSDATYTAKYGVRSVAGGGRSSARETTARVAAGAIAKKILRLHSNIEILAYVKQVQDITSPDINHDEISQNMIEANSIRCPHPETAKIMIERINSVRLQGNSLGGVIETVVRNVPAGLGSPVFDKLEADLAKACMSIPATKGFEIGSGFQGTTLTGKQHNDEFYVDKDGRTRTRTNRSGGVQGGISNGENIVIRVAFKPTSTISLEQNTVTSTGVPTTIAPAGRHDPCVLPRAVPIVESMIALVLVDALMEWQAQCGLVQDSGGVITGPSFDNSIKLGKSRM